MTPGTETTPITRGLDRALWSLVEAGENEPWSDGTTDPHVASEAYTDTRFRLATITNRMEERTHE